MRNGLKRGVIYFIALMLSLNMAACDRKASSSKQQKKKLQTMKVEKKPVYTTLTFSGTLQPFKEANVTAPSDGVISYVGFKYGQLVKKNDLLYLFDSSKEEEQFESALSAYLKAKQTLNTDEGELNSTQGLYKKGLVSRNEYDQAKSTYYLSRLSLLKAQSTLKKSLSYYSLSDEIFSLSISDIQSISKTLSATRKAEKIKILAPAAGVALFPTSGSSSSSSNSSGKKIIVGSEVKKGQVLVTIGQFEGLLIKAKADEVNINQLTPGLKASVTSVAFPGLTLDGYIKNIDSQASGEGNLPQFKMSIVVRELTPKERRVVKIGMSAKATVKIKEPAQIQIPIAAVFQKNGQSMVTKMVNGKPQAVVIQTGKTSVGEVIVLSGLKAGDEIVSSH